MNKEEKRQTGYVYTIRSHQTDLIYIGSTFQKLHKRLHQHRKYFEDDRKITSKEIIKFEDHYIELLAQLENISKLELQKQEGEYIRKMNCVNKYIAGRNGAEWHLDNKERRCKERKERHDQNKDYENSQNRQWKIDNSEHYKQQQKEYRERTKDQAKERSRKHYEKKKAEKILFISTNI